MSDDHGLTWYVRTDAILKSVSIFKHSLLLTSLDPANTSVASTPKQASQLYAHHYLYLIKSYSPIIAIYEQSHSPNMSNLYVTPLRTPENLAAAKDMRERGKGFQRTKDPHYDPTRNPKGTSNDGGFVDMVHQVVNKRGDHSTTGPKAGHSYDDWDSNSKRWKTHSHSSMSARASSASRPPIITYKRNEIRKVEG